MASQNLLIITTILTAILVLVFSPVNASAARHRAEPAPFCNDARLLAQDVIGVTLKQIRHTRDFVHSIPALRILKHQQKPEIEKCVVGLFDCLSQIRTVLYSLSHLKTTRQDTEALTELLPQLTGYSAVCNLVEKDLGAMLLKILDVKMVDTRLMILDVLYVVSQLDE